MFSRAYPRLSRISQHWLRSQSLLTHSSSMHYTNILQYSYRCYCISSFYRRSVIIVMDWNPNACLWKHPLSSRYWADSALNCQTIYINLLGTTVPLIFLLSDHYIPTTGAGLCQTTLYQHLIHFHQQSWTLSHILNLHRWRRSFSSPLDRCFFAKAELHRSPHIFHFSLSLSLSLTLLRYIALLSSWSGKIIIQALLLCFL